MCNSRTFACSSKEEGTICLISKHISGTIEVTLNTVMCLIKVNSININSTLYNAMQTMISGKDKTMNTNSFAHFIGKSNLFRFSGSEMFCITTVNMNCICIINVLKIIITELISKQQSRSNHKDCPVLLNLKTPHCILNLNQGLATTSRNNNLTQRMGAQSVKCSLLMGTKSDHQCVSCNIGPV